MDPPPRPSEPASTSQAQAQTPAVAPTFPKLEVLDPETPHTFIRPSKCINDGADLEHFHKSKAYRDIGVFLFQLNRALCPRKVSGGDQQGADARPGAGNTKSFPLNIKTEYPAVIETLQELLRIIESLVEQEAPPEPGPRRFGNAAFRKWHAILEKRIEGYFLEMLPGRVLYFGQGDHHPKDEELEPRPEGEASPLDELKAYFLGGFGSAQRLDYGTGHELSFLAFLGSLWKLGAFHYNYKEDPTQPGQIERLIVLGVIEPYMKVIRRLITVYTLEPAGSHGVWGLDDHSFLPYIFGSAQFTRPISEDEPMPLEGSAPRTPKPSDVTKPASVEVYRETNMYFSAIGFIYDVKKGPFWEHSPMLFDISGIKDGWGKINKGMIKMYNAEVLSKFPVVQHFLFGSLFSWEKDEQRKTTQNAS